MKKITRELIAIIVLALIILLGMFVFSGCQPQRRADLTPETEAGKLDALKADKIIEKIYETNLLISGFIVVAAIGVFCMASRQIQLGLALIATGLVGIWITRADQSLAQNQWLLLIPTGLLVVGGAVWVFKNEQIWMALREIVKGGDLLKGEFGQQWSNRPKAFKECQRACQSKPTEKIIRKIKAKL